MAPSPELTNGSDIGALPSGLGQPRRSPVLRSIPDLEEPLVQDDICFTLSNAQVLWANYDLIQHDFIDIDFASGFARSTDLPRNPSVLSTDRPDIDAWLLHYAAIISAGQLRQTDTNEPIPVCGPARVAYRPPRYGRALVVQLQDTWPGTDFDKHHHALGLLDVKGCGVSAKQFPSVRLHRTGLLVLPFALAEIVAQLILERIFESLQVDIRGVGLYAILDLGFRTQVDGCWMPAAAIVRRAHQRPPGNIERPDYGMEQYRLKLAVEFMLRPFGVTSCSPATRFRIWCDRDQLHSSYSGRSDKIPSNALERFLARMSLRPPVEFDMIDVQLVRGATLSPLSADLVDFGQYDFASTAFINPLACSVQDRPLHWGGFIDRNSSCWVQPNPEISVNDILAGWVSTPAWLFDWLGPGFPMKTTPLFLFSAELARDMTLSGLTSRDIEKRICQFVESATSKLHLVQEVSVERVQCTSPSNAECVPGTRHASVLDAFAHVEEFQAQNALRLRPQHVAPPSTIADL